jgi:D-arabinose 5-phosphate isomerase GutQ
MSTIDYIAAARQVFKREGRAVSRLAETIDPESFNSAVTAILETRKRGGRVLATGRGNSGSVARKIAYSLCCVNVPSTFLAPGNGYHASNGLLQPGDLLIAVSRGGDTADVIELMKIARQKKASIIAVTANPASTMAMTCDVMIRVPIERDPDPNDYLDTTCILAMTAVFDAMALAIQPLTAEKED